MDTVLRYRAENPTMPLFRRHVNGAWVNVTAAQFADEVDAVAKGLIASGVAAGDRVAPLSSTRYEWTVIDYAIWRAGATTVAIFDTSSPDQVDWILTNSGRLAGHPGDPEEPRLPRRGHQNCPEVRETLIIDDGAIAELARRGAAVTDADLDARHAGSNAADAATLIYTSGHDRPTQGRRPDACELPRRGRRGSRRVGLDDDAG